MNHYSFLFVENNVPLCRYATFFCPLFNWWTPEMFLLFSCYKAFMYTCFCGHVFSCLWCISHGAIAGSYSNLWGLPRWRSGEESACQCRRYKRQIQSPGQECWGPASAGSRGTFRMNGVGEKKRERERPDGGAAESGKSLFFTIAFIV